MAGKTVGGLAHVFSQCPGGANVFVNADVGRWDVDGWDADVDSSHVDAPRDISWKKDEP